MPKKPRTYNEFQRAAADSYDGGHFNHTNTAEQAEEIGELDDSLFMFLIRELQDPETKEEAIRRLNTAIENIGEVILRLEMS